MRQTNPLRLLNIIYLCFVIVCLTGLYLYLSTRFDGFPFFTENLVSVGVFFILCYLLFFLRYTFFAYKIPAKLVLLIALIPIFMRIQQNLQSYLLYFEQFVLEDYIVSRIPYKHNLAIVKFVNTEYTFFAISALIIIPILGLRLIVSIWRNHNRNKV